MSVLMSMKLLCYFALLCNSNFNCTAELSQWWVLHSRRLLFSIQIPKKRETSLERVGNMEIEIRKINSSRKWNKVGSKSVEECQENRKGNRCMASSKALCLWGLQAFVLPHTWSCQPLCFLPRTLMTADNFRNTHTHTHAHYSCIVLRQSP